MSAAKSGRLAMLRRIAKHVPTPDTWTLTGRRWSHSDGRTFSSWWLGQWRDGSDAPWFGAPDGHPDSFERVDPLGTCERCDDVRPPLVACVGPCERLVCLACRTTEEPDGKDRGWCWSCTCSWGSPATAAVRVPR